MTHTHVTDGLDVNDVIREALALERDDLHKHRIQVRVDSSTQLKVVPGDRVQLQQVVLNLIANAVHAMAGAGEPRLLLVRAQAHPPAGVVVSISDTGMGVPAGDVERIFNPLFTTKADGMGMGLAICRSIVEAHDGRLWTVPNVPRGATFQFTLHSSRPSQTHL